MAEDRARLIRKIVEYTKDLPSSTLETVAESLSELSAGAGEKERAAVAEKICSGSARDAVTKLIREWNRHAPKIQSESIALVLQTVAEKEAQYKKSQSLQLVWSGPTPGCSILRRTDQVLYDLIKEAEKDVFIVTYAAYKIPKVREALVGAAKRGVRISLILRSKEGGEGELEISSLKALGSELPQSAAVYVWPTKKKKAFSGTEGKVGLIHAKCAFTDDKRLLISSANLTEQALSINMELGVLIRGGPLPREVAEHFRRLILMGELERVPRAK